MNMITKHFSKSEMACRCGCRSTTMCIDFMAKLELLRQIYGKALTITSGARCPTYNAFVKGAQRSFHLSDESRDANASDIFVTESTRRGALVHLACEIGFGGIGVSKDFIHVDSRPLTRSGIRSHPIIWTY